MPGQRLDGNLFRCRIGVFGRHVEFVPRRIVSVDRVSDVNIIIKSFRFNKIIGSVLGLGIFLLDSVLVAVRFSSTLTERFL